MKPIPVIHPNVVLNGLDNVTSYLNKLQHKFNDTKIGKVLNPDGNLTDEEYYEKYGTYRPKAELGVLGLITPESVVQGATMAERLPVVVRSLKRTTPEKYIYGGEQASHDGYIIENENVGEFLSKLYGKDVGNGYIAVHADPGAEKAMLTAADRDALVEQLTNLPSGSIISSYSKSPQGMLSYGVLAKRHPEKFELVQFKGESLPDFDYEYFPWSKWKEGMTAEEKLNILNKRRTDLGLPEGTLNEKGEMSFPWVALRRLNKGGKLR